MTCREVEPLLDARLDDELDIAGVTAVDRHLSECRVCHSQYTALQRLHEEITAADLAYIPPRGLEQKLAAALQPDQKSVLSFPSGMWLMVSIGAVAAVAAMLFFLYIPARTTLEADGLTTEILDSHLRSLQPNHSVDIPSSDQHTVKPWFQGKTSFSPPTPDLTNQGFILVGGRLEVIHQQPAAAIVYKRRQHVISLYVSPSDGSAPKMELRDAHGYHLLHWSRSGMNYWAVSDLNATELREFADLIRGS